MTRKKRKGSWRYLGYDAAAISRCAAELADSNLRLLGVASGLSVMLALAGVVFLLLVPRGMTSVIVVGCSGILFAVIYFISRWLVGNGKTHSIPVVEFLIYLFCYSCMGLGAYIGTVESGGDLAVLFVLYMVLTLVIFDRKPADNLYTALPPLAAFITLSFIYKEDAATIYDIADSLVALTIGMVVSWYKARLKIDNIITGAQLKKTNYALYHTSTTDPLTELPNRRLTFDKLNDVCTECKAVKADVACIVMDIDDFKAYNDIYGHPAGDRLLSKIGHALSGYAQERGMTVGRIGGEEFMAVWRVTSAAPPERTAEELRRTVEALNVRHSGSVTAPVVTVSLGLFAGRLPADQAADRMYTLADRALYEAKGAGKNRCWRYDALTSGCAPIRF